MDWRAPQDGYFPQLRTHQRWGCPISDTIAPTHGWRAPVYWAFSIGIYSLSAEERCFTLRLRVGIGPAKMIDELGRGGGQALAQGKPPGTCYAMPMPAC
jgi:hypothetical protein